MRNRSRHIFISPHPDDVIWSCGGRISHLLAAGEKVLVITVFDGDIGASSALNWLHEPWRRVANPLVRRWENQRVMMLLGADHVSLGFVDATYRCNGVHALYRSSDELFLPNVDYCAHDSEYELLDLLSQSLRDETNADDHIHFPLALSAHIDHVLVYHAAKTLPGSLYGYGEFAYPLYSPLAMEAIYCEVKFDDWLKLALLYRSQVLMLFGSAAGFESELLRYTRLHQGKNSCVRECYWRV